jgi:hypothetical protein
LSKPRNTETEQKVSGRLENGVEGQGQHHHGHRQEQGLSKMSHSENALKGSIKKLNQ